MALPPDLNLQAKIYRALFFGHPQFLSHSTKEINDFYMLSVRQILKLAELHPDEEVKNLSYEFNYRYKVCVEEVI